MTILAAPEMETSANPLAIEARGVRFAHRGGRETLAGVDLSVPRGGAVALLGASGAGKTTLLKVLAGLATPRTGAVTLRLPDAASPAAHRAKGRVGYIPQHLGLVRARRVLDNVLAGSLARVAPWRAMLGDFPADEVDAALEALDAVGLRAKAGERASRLSGGERQRVAIARALVQRPGVLFADEFVSNLDAVNASAVLDHVGRLRREGVAVVMALHNVELALAHADSLVVLADGRVLDEVDPATTSAEEIRCLLRA
ncbi:MAG TPA: ATP-binding cassette domain-containing protein [Candidatus Thermoplasmatota archaeon]|nr:ATP-binding cassette domain-containing protein [Candidatus Thermoplasmatota archaeon]